jgi:hypothetical protein
LNLLTLSHKSGDFMLVVTLVTVAFKEYAMPFCRQKWRPGEGEIAASSAADLQANNRDAPLIRAVARLATTK